MSVLAKSIWCMEVCMADLPSTTPLLGFPPGHGDALRGDPRDSSLLPDAEQAGAHQSLALCGVLLKVGPDVGGKTWWDLVFCGEKTLTTCCKEQAETKAGCQPKLPPERDRTNEQTLTR